METRSGPIIEMRDLSVGYTDQPVVSGIDLDVARREFVTLFGASGCGKSTLLHVVAGLLRPHSGTFRFDGQELRGVNTSVGYMTQTDTLLPWRTVEGNIALPLKLRKVPRDEIRDRVAELLAFLNLEAAATRYPAQLSGGMKRRCLLARSMIYRPEVLLMDEPFAAVDAQLREDLHEEVTRVAAELGQSILFVTHDVSEAALLSDRVLVLGGTPTTIVSELASPFAPDTPLAERRTSDVGDEYEHALRAALDAATRPHGHGQRVSTGGR